MELLLEQPTLFIEQDYWQAVLDRDLHYDGRFVYGVSTTGIYCRPSCAARRPLRKHVDFYPDGAAARAAGLRPCRRCQPDEQPFESALVEQTCGYIDAHLDQRLTLAEIAAAVHVSPSHLHRVFKRNLGLTPHQYVDARRVEQFTIALEQEESVTNAQLSAGYRSSSRVYGDGAARLGMTPRTYQRQGAGMQITYILADSPLGRLLVAATPRGVCQIALGGLDSELVLALHHQYPRADIHAEQENPQADAWLHGQVQAVLAYLSGQQPRLDLPLDLQVTAFQRQVYEALRAIPVGETRTYSQLAQAVGRPRAVRAVANACASNPTALIVPCHRIVRKNGELGGYRWGAERKEALLELEHRSDTIPEGK
jgi:AraC family transcriptional regulator of adaptative response/methylated-DNA-[protein]-cysteine methyltransferase